jgi:methanogenic corrinoid protein MtbC1
MLEKVIEPLMYKIGDMWRDGALSTVHEHLASAVVRSFLGGMAGYEHTAESAPIMISTSPAGQLHEFGALMAAIAASAVGWRSIYLGPNIPAEDIARAVRQSRARVVALSIVYPADDPRVGQEIIKLNRLLDNDVTLFIGGRAAVGYKDVIESVDAVFMLDLGHFQSKLESIRVSRGVNR